MTTTELTRLELESILVQAAQRGAEEVIRRMMVYDYAGAAKRIGVCENTLRKRIRERKINPVDGRITEVEIQRYLTASRPDRRRSG